MKCPAGQFVDKPLIANSWWDEQERDFIRISMDIRGANFETAEQAIHRTTPTIFDPEIGIEVAHPDVHPFRKSDDQEMLTEVLDTAKALITELELHFAERTLSEAFIDAWAKLHYCHGYLQCLYFSESDDMAAERGGARSAASRDRDAQRIWVSKMLKQKLDAGIQRQKAERNLAALIKEMLERNTIPSGFTHGWFEVILDKAQDQLNSSYSSETGKLSKALLLKLANNTSSHIPPIAW